MDDPLVHQVRGYTLRERIGEGGFGIVYLAVQPAVGRQVAIKVILPEYANRPDFIRRFEAEAQLVARLEHPHIVPLYDYWRDPDGAYLVMRYLRGGSLFDSLRHGPWEPDAAAQLLQQIASALMIAHRQGVVHRDVKPGNILLDEEGNSYLTDFGIAKDLMSPADLTQTGAVVGSFSYISPEQARGESVTNQSDLYGLGVVMHQILTGNHPFGDVTPAEQLVKHLTEPLPPLRERRPGLPDSLEAVIQRVTSKDPSERYADVLAFAMAFSEAVAGTTEATVATTLDRAAIELVNPYKGLRAFEEADAADFFGRERLVSRLLERLGEEEEASRFLAVVGPSGSGKSSVVKAGLLPALRRGALLGSERWFVVEMLPGTHPIDELEIGLLSVSVDKPAGLMEQLRRDERGLLRAARLVQPTEGSELLLIIDQFEELFTPAVDPADCAHLLRNLYVAVTSPRSQVRVIITLRADFYDRPLMHSEFSQLMRQRTEVVLPLTAEELAAAIRGPAEQAGAEFEAGVVEAIVADVREQHGALPMLQYALTELFERREGHLLTRQAYQTIGGVSGALARRAEEVYTGLSEGDQAAARQLFLRLVTLGEGAEDTRRRVLRGELKAIDVDQQAMDLAIETFGQSRLLLFDRDPATREPTVEVAHEALLREWMRLREWLDQSRADVRMERLLSRAAGEWIEAGQDPSFLLQGTRLAQFEGWVEGSAVALTQEEQTYLQESIARRELEQKAVERRRRITIAVSAGVAIMMTILGLYSAYQSREAVAARLEAERQVRVGRARELAARALAEDDPTGSLNLMLAREAVLTTWLTHTEVIDQPFVIEEAVTALSSAVYRAQQLPWRISIPWRSRHSGIVWSVGFDPDGRRIVSGGNDQTVRVWDANTGQELARLTGHTGIVYAVAFSPDGKRIASASDDGTIRIWDADTGQETGRLPGHTGGVYSVAFSPDGDRIASGGGDGFVRVWDVDTGQERFHSSGQVGWVWAVIFSPDSKRIYSGSGSGDIWVWDARTGQEISQMVGHTSSIYEVSLSEDGKRIASASDDGTVRVWDTDTGEEISQLLGHIGGVSSVALSPDGKWAVSGGRDKIIRVWDVDTQQLVDQFLGHTWQIRSVAVSPDGERIASSSEDSTVRIWNARTGQEESQVQGHTRSIYSVAVSPDGRQIVSASDDATVRVWDAETGQEISRHLDQTQNGFRSVAYSPNGEWFASGGEDGVVRVWDADTSEEINQLRGHSWRVLSIDCGPDAERIVSGGEDGTVRIWDVSSGQQVGQWPSGSEIVLSVAFGPDGERIVSGDKDGLVRVWDADTGQEIGLLLGHEENVYSVTFSPDGERVVSAGEDGTVRIWDPDTGQELGQLVGHDGQVLSVDYSADGRWIITAGGDGTVRTWDAETWQEADRFVGHTRMVWSAVFGPDGEWIVSAGTDETLRVWDTEVKQIVSQLLGHSGGVNSVVFGPYGRRIASGGADRTIWIWDLDTGQAVGQLLGHTGWVFSVAYSADGERIASGSADETVRVWDANTGQEVSQLSGHTDWVLAVAFSPDGGRIASGGGDQTVRVWDVDTGREASQLLGHTGDVHSVSFSPDGKQIASAGEDGTVRVWDPETEQEVSLLSGHAGDVHSAAFSPDGKQIVSGGEDGTVRVWDVDTGREVSQWLIHSVRILSVAFSPDGERIIGGDETGTVWVWDVGTEQEVSHLSGQVDWVRSVAFSPDGDRIVSGGTDGTIRIWFGNIEALLELADSLIQRDPPIFQGDERAKFGFVEQPAQEH